MATHLRSVFANNLRRTVERKGLRLNRVADDAGVSRAQMYNVLAGRSSPSLDWISKVSSVLGVSPAELLVDHAYTNQGLAPGDAPVRAAEPAGPYMPAQVSPSAMMPQTSVPARPTAQPVLSAPPAADFPIQAAGTEYY